MKRIICGIISLLFLTSCAVKSDSGKKMLNSGMKNAVIETDYLGTNYSAVYNYSQDRGLSIVMTAPEELKGITVTEDTNQFKVKFGSVELNYSDKKALDACPYLKLAYALKYVGENSYSKLLKNKEVSIYEFADGEVRYKVTADKASNTITKIEFEEYLFNISGNEVA